MKPTPMDILRAIEAAETGDWIDPTDLAPTYWDCTLYDPEGRQVGDGQADTSGLAMAMAWLCVRSPDALINGEVLDNVPLVVPDGWRFELTPPTLAKRTAELVRFNYCRAQLTSCDV